MWVVGPFGECYVLYLLPFCSSSTIFCCFDLCILIYANADTDPTEPIAYIDEQNESDKDDDFEILFVNDEKDDAE